MVVELAPGGAAVQVGGDCPGGRPWLRLEWDDWECCLRAEVVTRTPVRQNTVAEVRFLETGPDEQDFLERVLEALQEQFQAYQQRLANRRERRIRILRNEVEEGAYRPDVRATARRMLRLIAPGRS
jgi:hypothetical protein